MKKQKASEEKHKGIQSKSDLAFNNLAASLLNRSQKVLKEEEKISYKPCIVGIEPSKISEVIHTNAVKNWLKKTGVKPQKTLNTHQFAMDFFRQLDTHKTGEIEGENLLKSLLRFGIASDPTVLRRTLCLIFKSNHLNSLKINSQDFIGLFKAESRTDRILKKLNEHSLNERENKQRKIDLENKIKNETSTSFSNAKIDPSKAFAKSLGLLIKNNNYEKHANLITINEHLDIIIAWWKSLENNELNAVSIDIVIKLFVTIGIATDRNDSRSMIFSQLGVKSSINYDEFQQLFAKSMLKGALLNLSRRLFGGKFASEEMSSEFKLSAYQRALMMSGVKCPNSEISMEEGASTMLAIEKYNIQMKNHEK